jgi:hypothetical protein
MASTSSLTAWTVPSSATAIVQLTVLSTTSTAHLTISTLSPATTNCTSGSFNYTSDCFSCTSIYYDYNFDSTASMTASTAFPTALVTLPFTTTTIWPTFTVSSTSTTTFSIRRLYFRLLEPHLRLLHHWFPTTCQYSHTSIKSFTKVYIILSVRASRLHSLYLVVLNSNLAYYHMPKS